MGTNMTRKHFQALAAIVAKCESSTSDDVHWRLANDMADFCAQQNTRFDRDRFMVACGYIKAGVR